MSDQLLDDMAAHYVLVKGERPDLPPDDLIAIIADRMGLDAELELASGAEQGSSFIRDFVYEMEYSDDDQEDEDEP